MTKQERKIVEECLAEAEALYDHTRYSRALKIVDGLKKLLGKSQ